MIRNICFIALLIGSSIARDNPFFSTDENTHLPASNNKFEKHPPLVSLGYHFPSQARVLKEASFTFQNLDGSIETRRIEIDQSIDWRNPLMLSQAHSNNTSTEMASAKSSSADFGFIHFSSSLNRMTIAIKGPMIRYFTLSDPSSIVVDFQYIDLFTPLEKSLSASPFMKVKVANHGKFTRAIITLDGHYNCSATNSNQETIIICK